MEKDSLVMHSSNSANDLFDESSAYSSNSSIDLFGAELEHGHLVVEGALPIGFVSHLSSSTGGGSESSRTSIHERTHQQHVTAMTLRLVEEEAAALRARLAIFDQMILTSSGDADHQQHDAFLPLTPQPHFALEDDAHIQNDEAAATSPYAAGLPIGSRQEGGSTAPTADDIRLANVVLIDPMSASMVIQELFRRNRAVLDIAKRQQELLELQRSAVVAVISTTNISFSHPLMVSTNHHISNENNPLRSEHGDLPPHPCSNRKDDEDKPPERISTNDIDNESNGTTNVSSCFLPVAAKNDADCLMPFQVQLRQCLEFFVADDDDDEGRTPDDDATTVSRPSRPKSIIRPSQVGIRCRFCRAEKCNAAMQYPRALRTVYQAANRIATTHLMIQDGCPHLPKDMANSLRDLACTNPGESTVSTKKYWIKSCVDKGIQEKECALWLK